MLLHQRGKINGAAIKPFNASHAVRRREARLGRCAKNFARGYLFVHWYGSDAFM
jgi:hypothetical protein